MVNMEIIIKTDIHKMEINKLNNNTGDNILHNNIAAHSQLIKKKKNVNYAMVNQIASLKCYKTTMVIT
jgi:hypothetical protein